MTGKIKWTKTLLGAILGIGTVTVISCGGGGGGSSSGSSNTSPAYEGTYSGAASAGDLATFTVNGTQLTYHVWGSVFGNITGTLTLVPWAAGNGFFWKNDTEGVYLAVFKNVGVAAIDTENGTATVVGLHEPSNVTDFDFNRTFVFTWVYKENNGTQEVWKRANGLLSFNTTAKTATFEFYPDETTKTYNYTVNTEANTIDILNGTDVVVHILYKKADTGNEFLVMDLAGGKGFGMGRDTTPLQPDETKTYKVYFYGESLVEDDTWWGNSTVYYDSGLGKWISKWQDSGVYNGTPYTEKGTTVLHFNTLCVYNETTGEYDLIPFNGTGCGCAYNETAGEENRTYCGNALVDVNNQMYINMRSYTFEIGGW
jgi:hypothetical protein